MSEVTRLLDSVERGDPAAAEDLLPLLYEELRRLASAKMADDRPGQTLQPTALVHEAWLRLLGPAAGETHWNSRGHFFGAAAEAMRRILIDHARHRQVRERSESIAAAAALDLPLRTAERIWTFARTWLQHKIQS